MKFHFRGFGCVFVPFAMFNSIGVIHSSSSEDTIFSHDSTDPFDVFEPRFTDTVHLFAFQEVANGRFIKKPYLRCHFRRKGMTEEALYKYEL